MKLKLWLLPFLSIYLLLISATSIKVEPQVAVNDNKVPVVAPSSTSVKEHKLNFFERLILKLALKKYKVADPAKADKQANASLIFGIVGASLLVIGSFVPYVGILCLPAAIAAMIIGGSALRGGTQKVGAAKTGKGLGLGTLIAFGVLLLIAALIVAAWLGSWRG